MLNSQRFPFVERVSGTGLFSKMPYLPITLSYGAQSIETTALLDTGASVNVLPYEVGLQLGAAWENQTVPIQISGNLALLEARGIVISGTVDGFEPVPLAFAWTQSREAPLILGHMNFFAEFDVCFYSADSVLELRSRPK
ncbi:MAG: retroviral-like aspartic protease [Cyanobacteria bacterium J06626_6]